MKKRVIASMLSLVMVLSSVVGCGNSNTASTETNVSKEPTAAAEQKESKEETEEASTEQAAEMSKEPITLTLMNRVNAEIVFDNNPMLEEIAEKTGVTLEIDAPPISNYTDRLQIVMASGDLPDIIYTWSFDSNYEKWAADGLIWELDDLIGKYPNLTKNITKNMWEMARTSTTGKIHAVPRPTGTSRWGVIANEEWLKKLDTTMPTNVDELYEYGKKVATMDPDGNGKDDTFLFSPTGLWTDCWLIFSFLPFSVADAPLYLPDFDGEYKIKEKMDGYIPYLEYMRKLYAEKILDPEFFVNNYYDDRTKFQQGRTALLHGGAGNIAEFTKDVSNALDIYKFYPAMIAEGQSKPRNEAAAATWGGWMISKDVEGEKLERVLEFLDWANSEEGFITMAAGAEGIDYTSYDFANRVIEKTEEQIELSKTHTSSYMTIAWAYDGLLLSPSDTPEKIAFCMKEIEDFDAAVDWVDVPTVSTPKLTNWKAENPDMATRKSEMEVKFVVGEISLEEFQKFLEDEFYPSVAEAEEEYIQVMNAYAGK